MIEWAALQHAYGTAEDVPDLLRAAEEASYAVLPLLADLAERHEPAGHVAALDLAAAIVASTDGPTDPATVRAEHAETVSRLCGLAERNLSPADGDVAAHARSGARASRGIGGRAPGGPVPYDVRGPGRADLTGTTWPAATPDRDRPGEWERESGVRHADRAAWGDEDGESGGAGPEVGARVDAFVGS